MEIYHFKQQKAILPFFATLIEKMVFVKLLYRDTHEKKSDSLAKLGWLNR